MKIHSDWHIHTPHSCDCREKGVEISTLAATMAEKGISQFGITDHIHTPYNLVDLFNSYEAFVAANPGPDFHFGVEVSVVSQWELDEIESGRELAKTYGLREGGPKDGPPAIGLSEEDIREYHIEYVIAGVHWPLYVEMERDAVIRDYHRQNLFAATHPLVTIVGHPWWWMGHWVNDEGNYLSDPWLDDFGKIPLSMHDEFAAAVVENEKAVEINLEACLFNPHYPREFTKQYADYLAYLAERKVTFSIGSDSHGPEYSPDFETAESILNDIGIGEEQLWSLPPRSEPIQVEKKDNWQEKKRLKKLAREAKEKEEQDRPRRNTESTKERTE
ncbi:MAG: PHP domain-containing protein [Planctomycetota bacterium]|jgi:histidinol phosphatase-like PHP family hydrolase